MNQHDAPTRHGGRHARRIRYLTQCLGRGSTPLERKILELARDILRAEDEDATTAATLAWFDTCADLFDAATTAREHALVRVIDDIAHGYSRAGHLRKS